MFFPDPWHSCPGAPIHTHLHSHPSNYLWCSRRQAGVCALVCGGGGRVERDDRVIFIAARKRGTAGKLGEGTRRGGTVSRKICRGLSVNVKRNIGIGIRV